MHFQLRHQVYNHKIQTLLIVSHPLKCWYLMRQRLWQSSHAYCTCKHHGWLPLLLSTKMNEPLMPKQKQSAWASAPKWRWHREVLNKKKCTLCSHPICTFETPLGLTLCFASTYARELCWACTKNARCNFYPQVFPVCLHQWQYSVHSKLTTARSRHAH